ncbi:fibroblast growth factor 21-like [Carassius auratus]|uniref:Fibroblast growth factor 21-like n=1 Tax=Carassius auratus TaxID=7957 RepID=A0A6P6JW71_CARAU|nr:fibroblast growth factor 21-like [Carassius auratus]
MSTCSTPPVMLFACFFIFFALCPPLHWCMYVPVESVLLPFSTQVRECLLYTDNRKYGLFLEMKPDGSVLGSQVQKPDCVLNLRSVKAGETVIQSAATSLFLCVDDEDNLKGQSHYTEGDCTFQELLLPDGYSYFLSPHTKNPVSLLSKKSGLKHSAPLSRFLPLVKTQLAMAEKGEDSQIQGGKQYIKDINLDSDDPLGIGHHSHIETVFSPSLHTRK